MFLCTVLIWFTKSCCSLTDSGCWAFLQAVAQTWHKHELTEASERTHHQQQQKEPHLFFLCSSDCTETSQLFLFGALISPCFFIVFAVCQHGSWQIRQISTNVDKRLMATLTTYNICIIYLSLWLSSRISQTFLQSLYSQSVTLKTDFENLGFADLQWCITSLWCWDEQMNKNRAFQPDAKIF